MLQKINKYDIIVTLCISVIALVILGGITIGAKDGGYAVVTVDGEHYGEYSLEIDGRFDIGSKERKTTLVIENGSARIEDASCPDKSCEKQGSIRFNRQSLVCLPNATVVTVVSNKNSQIDFVQ